METETHTRPTVMLGDSITQPKAVTIGRPDLRGKAYVTEILTKAELSTIVQAAYDQYGIAATPDYGKEAAAYTVAEDNRRQSEFFASTPRFDAGPDEDDNL